MEKPEKKQHYRTPRDTCWRGWAQKLCPLLCLGFEEKFHQQIENHYNVDKCQVIGEFACPDASGPEN